MSYEAEEVSDEEKLQIAQHFLLSSPPGSWGLPLAVVTARSRLDPVGEETYGFPS